MKNQTNLPLAFLGKCLGRPLAWVLRKQSNLLINKGFSPKVAKWLLITLNLLVLMVILMMIFPMWMMFIIAFVVFVACTGVDIDFAPPHNKYEYRGGTDGFGLYDNETGWRVDCGSIEDEDTYMGRKK